MKTPVNSNCRAVIDNSEAVCDRDDIRMPF
jgi:hypothetical protein